MNACRHIFFLLILLFSVNGCFACMHVCVLWRACVCGACRNQKRALHPLEPELHVVVSLHVSAWN